jgi:hypothetical protein
MALNSLCMPGLFYHYICLMRTWGLDFAAPPMFGIYPDPPFPTLLTETTPQLVAALSVYMLSYEFIYYWYGPPSTAELHLIAAPEACTPLCTLYLHPVSAPSLRTPRCALVAPSAPSPRPLCRWHRAMHEVPVLYKWVHKHHHQQTYPDRAAIDTFNTGCIESQVRRFRPPCSWP